MNWPDYYILVGRTPVAVDVLTWGKWFGTAKERFIAETIIDDTPVEHTYGMLPGREKKYMRPKIRVSTVFLGLNSSFRPGEPMLFETMIFGGSLDGEQWRYATYDQAERGHADAVVQARKAAAQIKALADEAGAKK